MSRAEWFSTKAKVAVAVAVIRNRPPGMSGRQHAEALGRELRLQDEGSKKKAEELQQEVLRLRQEVLMAKATSAGTSSTQAADSSGMDDPSQDLFGSGSVGFSEELQPDCDSETPDVFQQNAEPPAASPPPPVPSGHREEDALCPHVQFLQSLCALHRVEGRGKGLEALWFGRDGDAGSVLADTVCRLLDSVVAACRDPSVLGSHNLVLKACQVAARAMDLYCSQRLPSAELMRRGEEPLRELSRMLLHSDQPGRSQLEAAEKLMEYLITVGSSRMSASFLIGHILSEISALADELWQAFQAQHGSVLDAFPVARYHNSCRLFGVLEELLQRPEVASRVEVGSERAVFLSHVEQRVFLLSDEFPLFSIRMWRIGGLLGSLNRQDGPE
ncbi:meiosis-specific protein MEI4 isoform X1 [Archocentrus centrarchus]|uniref:meiosis-specific protein MEI4 isoform X1 n=1 Tax=Archocentrus centrarchus TaxID=63155 RepID=UPI0011E9BCB4|nr:meiosis-specific protein MEI4 isoform X1 [Archocentrus centrarchus]XP_030578015.1 meiosis-specific protein MEI4 isoform X1 [Archocentrus centrarchus]